jgi:hypothetical protein
LMIPHTATPAPIAVTTVLSAVTLLVKNAMIVFKTDFLKSVFPPSDCLNCLRYFRRA